MGSKTVLLGKLALVFFISLLTFSVGVFVGKKYSDNQHQLAALEPNKEGHGADAAHGDTAHGDAGHGEAAAGHGEGGEHGENREIASEGGHGAMTDDEIAKLAEEFVADDTHTTAAAAHGEADAHGDAKGHGEANTHGEAKAHSEANTHGKDPHAKAPAESAHAAPVANRKTASNQVAMPAHIESENLAMKPTAAKMREHNPPVESRVPTSLPKDVGQYQPGKFTVQVAAYTDETEAKKMATDLKGRGYSAFYVPALVRGKTYFRVSVGQFATQQEASLFRAELVEKAKVGSAIVQKITQ